MKVVDGVGKGKGEGVETLEGECGERWKALMSCRTRRLRVGAAAAAEARSWLTVRAATVSELRRWQKRS